MLRTAIYLAIFVLIVPLVSPSGNIQNSMVGDLIINGGANESKLNNNTLRVCADGCNYSSIQSAIHAAIPWSVIEVQNGSYDEDLNITKPLLFKSVGGMVFYEGTIMPFHYPVTFSGENHKNHFASVYLDSPPWHHRCEACESYEQFSECYQEFVDAAPSNAKIWRDYAADQKEIWQKYEDALASIDQALQIDPRFSEAWEIKGILLNKLGRYQDAVTACERAIELDRFDDGAWSEKGFAFCQMKSYEEAILAYDEAIRLNPEDDDAWNSKGYALHNLGKYDEAILAYDEAIRLNPEDDDAWNNKGVALDNLGKYDDAILAYGEAIRLNPVDANTWNNKGITLDNLGKYDEAILAYDKAIRIEPEYASAWNNKGKVLYKLGKYDEAVQAYDEAIKLDPEYASAWHNKGTALYYLGRYDEAILACDKAIRLDPEDASAWNNTGYALKRLGRTTEANAAFAKALELGRTGDTEPVEPQKENETQARNVTSIAPAEQETNSISSEDYSSGEILYSAAFPNGDIWKDIHSYHINQNGQRHITVSRPGSFSCHWPTKKPFSDFVLDVETTVEGGPADNAYGVVLRQQSSGREFYRFKISSDGYYGFDLRKSAEWEDIVPWTKSDVINTGKASNQIRVVCQGSTFSYEVNGVKLGECTDNTLASGMVGFIVEALSQGGVEVAFGNFTIRELPGK